MGTHTGTLSKAGSIHHVEGGYFGLSSMNEPSIEAAIGDSLHNPKGSVMGAGFFKLKASELLGTTVKFKTPDYAPGFFAGQRSFAL
ncbi:hypothetical protein AAGW05_18330 [Arthrobacter sp. LAPM80]|uniref:hypothetical protein n=1 Tax=Arthrobacter sp. LAPM80 TaxID=3141788 RepID=UPI00398AB4B9